MLAFIISVAILIFLGYVLFGNKSLDNRQDDTSSSTKTCPYYDPSYDSTKRTAPCTIAGAPFELSIYYRKDYRYCRLYNSKRSV